MKERKVYDLAAAGEIPHRRVTGKLLFPADEIAVWIGGPTAGAPTRPPVLAGSHDPLLDWAARESASGLATLWCGSVGGLDAFARGEAALCGLHLPEGDGWNVATVDARAPRGAVLVSWAVRARGLLLGPGPAAAARGLRDLSGRKVALRQPGSGAAALLDTLLAEAGMRRDDLVAVAPLARTESEAAEMVAAGEAEAALGIEAMARRFGLGFLPLRPERFDLLIDRRAYFTPPVQTLLGFARGEAMRARAAAMGGYGVDDLGAVRWLGA